MLCVITVRVGRSYSLRLWFFFFFQAEDGIRDLVRSRGLGDVYKRQGRDGRNGGRAIGRPTRREEKNQEQEAHALTLPTSCLLYTSDAADERSSVDLGGRRIIKKKTENVSMRNTPNT